MRTLPLLHGIVAVLVSQFASAQGFFFEAHGTYQLPIGGQTDAEVNAPLPVGGTQRTFHYERVNLNWGRGAGGGITIGRAFTQHISAELRATWFPRTRTSWHSEEGNSISDEWMEMSFLRIEPALRLTTCDSASAWYVSIGPSLALFPFSKFSYEQQNYIGDYHYDYASVYEYSGGLGWGAFAGVGYIYRTKGRIGFFAEVNCTAQAWSPDRREMTKSIAANEDRLSTLYTYERVVDYADDFSTDGTIDPDEPAKALRYYNPMSSWGARAGLHITLRRRVSRQ